MWKRFVRWFTNADVNERIQESIERVRWMELNRLEWTAHRSGMTYERAWRERIENHMSRHAFHFAAKWTDEVYGAYDPKSAASMRACFCLACINWRFATGIHARPIGYEEQHSWRCVPELPAIELEIGHRKTCPCGDCFRLRYPRHD